SPIPDVRSAFGDGRSAIRARMCASVATDDFGGAAALAGLRPLAVGALRPVDRKARRLPRKRTRPGLLPQPEPGDDLLVPRPILARQVLQELVAAADELQQAPTRGVVLLVLVEVLPQVVDPLGQNGDLHLRRT